MAKPQPSFPFPYTKQCSPIVSLTIFGQCTQSVFPLLMLRQLKYFAVRKDIILMFYFDSVVCVCVLVPLLQSDRPWSWPCTWGVWWLFTCLPWGCTPPASWRRAPWDLLQASSATEARPWWASEPNLLVFLASGPLQGEEKKDTCFWWIYLPTFTT